MKIDKKQVEHIARLARLDVTEAEIEEHAEKLSAVLDYFDELSKVDTSGVEPVTHVTGAVNVMREDELRPEAEEISREDLLAGAPEVNDGFIKTKGIIE